MPDFEDSSAGATDISGTPDPVRTPQKVAGDTARKVNRQQLGPRAGAQPKGDSGNPLQGAEDAVKGAADKAGQALEQSAAERPFQDTGMEPGESWNPVDWGKQVANDASVAWGLGRRAYQGWKAFSDPAKINTSIQHIYAGDSAFDQFMKLYGGFLSIGPAPEDPIQSLTNRATMLKDVGQAAETAVQQGPGQAVQQAEQARAPEAEATTAPAVQSAPDAALMLAAPEAKIGQAALNLGLPIGQALLSTDPNEQKSALAWMALSGAMMGVFHLPAGTRNALERAFGAGWPEVEKRLAGVLDQTKLANRNMADPQKMAEEIHKAIDTQLAAGSMPEEYRSLPQGKGRARRPDAEVPVPAFKDPTTGAVRFVESGERKSVQNLLNRIGVQDVEDLVHKAATEGINDPDLYKAVIDRYPALGLGYDLKRWHPAETPNRDLRRHLDDIADRQAGNRFDSATRNLLDQVHRGLFAGHSDPHTAMLRAVAGHSRTTRLAWQNWTRATVKLLDKTGMMTEEGQAAIGRASEGDEQAYEKLPSEAKMVADAWGLMRSAGREEARGTDYSDDFVPNYMPRTDKLPEEMTRARGRPSKAGVLGLESLRHREEHLTTDPAGQLVLGQRFQYVQDANEALKASRAALLEQMMGEQGPKHPDLLGHPLTPEIRRDILSGTPDAVDRAKRLVQELRPDKETNFLKNVNRVFPNQIRAIHTQQALTEFLRMKAKDGRAVAIKPATERLRQGLIREQGYSSLDDRRFGGYLFHPDLAKNLNRYVNHMTQAWGEGPGAGSKVVQAALKLEGLIVAGIMFSPLMHGMNMAGRFGMAYLMNPIEMTHYLTHGKRIPPELHEDLSWALQSQAHNAGVGVHFQNRSYVDNAISKMQDEYGDHGDNLPDMSKADTWKNRMGSLVEQAARPHRFTNNLLWGKVNDFGVMMYHVELAAARKHGMGNEAAMEYAARRANTWMGMVLPEDKNPQWHNLTRLAMFAPNWWRTWAELMVPIYKRSGFTQDEAYAKFAAYQSAKTMTAALAFQKMSGNALNYAFSGHLQNENQPGQQDRIEVSRPQILGALQSVGIIPSDQKNAQYIDPQTGVNPKTGAHYVIENPVGRFQQDVETAAGLQSGQRDWQPSDLQDGMAKEVAARLSPLLGATGALFNWDVYHTMADGTWRSMDPSQPGLRVSPATALYSALMMTPAGLNLAQQIQNQAGAGNQQPVQSVLGTQVPTGVRNLIGDMKDPAERTAFSMLTGTNPAYAQAQRTRGTKPSDEDYQKASEYQKQYQTQMHTLSVMASSGQMTPSQWKQAYHDLSMQHSAQMEALYRNAPQYVNGPDGMLADWENLYQQATNPQTGQVDYDHLNILQQQFTNSHSPEQMQQMNALLHANDSKYPMLKLYHDTFAAYDKFQQDWATQNNVDLNQLRKEISAYGQTYGDRRASAEYEAQHRDLAKYERAKQRWEHSEAGVLYSLFYGNTANTVRYLGGHRETAAQLVTQAEQQGVKS